MKNISYLFVLITCSIFHACSDENSSNSTIDDPIIGKWGNYQDVFLPDEELVEYNPYNEIITYNTNGTASATSTIFGDAEGS